MNRICPARGCWFENMTNSGGMSYDKRVVAFWTMGMWRLSFFVGGGVLADRTKNQVGELFREPHLSCARLWVRKYDQQRRKIENH